jgi:hypothetical protein
MYDLKSIIRAYNYGIRFIKKYENTVLFERFNTCTIINYGANSIVNFEGAPLVYGQAFEIGGNMGEVNFQQYNISFSVVDNTKPYTFYVLIVLKNYT